MRFHEEILKHKRDAIEWGIIGVEAAPVSTPVDDAASVAGGEKRDRSGLGLVKDKTALGLGMNSWGRAPRDGLGRGPRPLRSVWKEWNDAEEYATRFEVLSVEEVERREIERERPVGMFGMLILLDIIPHTLFIVAFGRETSRFQHSTTRRRR